MANVDKKGFEPYRHRSGASVLTREVLIKVAGVSAACHKGSFVKQLASLDEWDIASAGDAIDSLCMGFKWTDATTGKEMQSDFLPTGISYTHDTAYPKTGVYMKIVDDAFNVDFIGQLNGIVVAPTTAERLNADIVQTATDTAATSGQEIAYNTLATTTAQLRCLGFFQPQPQAAAASSSDVTLTHAKMLVRINESESDPAQTATAVGAAS